jgi:hypothetical protein
MNLVRERLLVVNGGASIASACGVTTLNHEAGNQPVENCVVVVAFQTQLDEVSTRLGTFVSP